MRVQFLGFKQQKRSGCPVCGKSRVSEYSFQREKRMVLPSGKAVTFYAGQIYDFSETDIIFLLNQVDSGGNSVFKAVD